MQQQRGFTLIELIIVIVILGILAVTAAPRFINLQGDARAATLQGVQAALQGGAQLVYAKAAIQGVQTTADATVNIDGTNITADFGYPSGEDVTTASLAAWLDADTTNDFTLTVGASGATTPDEGAFAITPSGVAYSTTATAQCQVIYTEPGATGASPTVIVETGGC